jgi:predicted site-specific integrase-resolvase
MSLLTKKEFAKRYAGGAAPATIDRWIAKGRISVVRLSKRMVRIRESEAEKFIKRCER